jgi:serine protease Do
VKGSVPRFLQNGVAPGGLVNSSDVGGAVVALDSGEIVGVLAAPRKEPPKGPQSTGLNLEKSHGAVMSIGITVVVPQILMASALEPGIKNPVAVAGEKGWIGIEEFQPMGDAIAKTFGREPGAGAIVSLVGDDSPAARAGLEVEDLLVSIDGEPVAAKDETAVQDLRRRIRKSVIGSTLVLGLERNGKPLEIPVVVAAAPKSVYEAETYVDEVFGVTVKEITYDVIQRKNLDAADLGCVIVHKVPLAGLFSIAGLQPDDILVGVNDLAVKDVASFKAAIEKMKKERKKEVVLKVKRGSDTRFQKVKPDWN